LSNLNWLLFIMKQALEKIKNYFSSNFEVLAATAIFIAIFAVGLEFYKAIILMLEFIVVMEVVKMISDFIKKQKLRLRFVIDIFIIFLIRDVIILSTDVNKDYFDISFLLAVIFVFFIFRILAIKFSPGTSKEDSNAEQIKERQEEYGR